jgi:plasmid stability protein
VTVPRNRKAFARGHALRAEIRALLEQHLQKLQVQATGAIANDGLPAIPLRRRSS